MSQKHQLNILLMRKEELLQLRPEQVTRLLAAEEVVHIAKTLDAFWGYDYEAAKLGKTGLHAILKSLLHSDGFFISRIMLQHENIRKIMADQQAMRIKYVLYNEENPDWVGGIPDGATELGEDLADSLGSRHLIMEKVGGKIVLVSNIAPGESVLLCEDFCTRGTGFKEAVQDIVLREPGVNFVLYEPVVINRGGLRSIEVEGVGSFKILAIADHRINDWDPNSNKGCPLCNLGSVPIKPKATDENWQRIKTSQS